MSPERENTTIITPEAKQHLEAQILAGGEGFDQSRVDAVMSRVALEAPQAHVADVHVTDEGKKLLAEFTPDPTEGNGESDAVAIEAAQRQLDLNTLYAKQTLDTRAAQEGWSQDKYDDALQQLHRK